MKTLKYFMLWMVVMGLAFISCDKESDYIYPTYTEMIGTMVTLGDYSNAVFPFDLTTHTTYLVPGKSPLTGYLNTLGNLDDEASYIEFVNAHWNETKGLFDLEVNLNIVNPNEDGLFNNGTWTMNTNGDLNAQFNIARTYGNLNGRSGSVDLTGKVDFEKRWITIYFSGYIEDVSLEGE